MADIQNTNLVSKTDIETVLDGAGLDSNGNSSLLVEPINDFITANINAASADQSGGDGNGGRMVLPIQYFNPDCKMITTQSGGQLQFSKVVSKVVPTKKISAFTDKIGLKSTRKNILLVKSLVAGALLYAANKLFSLVKNKDKKVGKTHVHKLKKHLNKNKKSKRH